MKLYGRGRAYAGGMTEVHISLIWTVLPAEPTKVKVQYSRMHSGRVIMKSKIRIGNTKKCVKYG